MKECDGMVYQFFKDPGLENPFFELGQFDDFLDSYVLGEKYLEFFRLQKKMMNGFNI